MADPEEVDVRKANALTPWQWLRERLGLSYVVRSERGTLKDWGADADGYATLSDGTPIRLLLATLLVLTALAGCSSKPDTAACERAMRADYQAAQQNPNGPAAQRPRACEGLDDKTVQDLATKIMSGQ